MLRFWVIWSNICFFHTCSVKLPQTQLPTDRLLCTTTPRTAPAAAGTGLFCPCRCRLLTVLTRNTASSKVARGCTAIADYKRSLNIYQRIQSGIILGFILQLCRNLPILLMSKRTVDWEQTLQFIPSRSESDVIMKVARMTRGRSDVEVYEMAYRHFIDALNFSSPRMQFNMGYFYLIYEVQSSQQWRHLTVFLSYLYMCLAMFCSLKPEGLCLRVECLALCIFVIDLIMEVFHRRFEALRDTSTSQLKVFLRMTLLQFLVIDFLVALFSTDGIIRPLIVLRCFLPIFYHHTLRKNLQAMLQLYQDIIVFTFIYFMAILAFAVAFNQFIVADPNKKYDPYTQDFSRLGSSMFLTYTLASYEAFPENEWKSIQSSHSIIFMYLFFILLNMFLFVNIPTSLLFQTFKETKSKAILVDEIKQQNSMILCFVCLSRGSNELSIGTVIKFLKYCYKQDDYVEFLARVIARLDQNQNKSVEMSEFMQLGKIIQSLGSPRPPIIRNWQRWVQFRRNINREYNLKQFLLSGKFKIAFSTAMVLSTFSCLLCMYTDISIFKLFDHLLTLLFLLELVVKLVAIGPFNFFMDPWNKLDCFLILLSLFLFVCVVCPSLPLHHTVKQRNILYLVKLTRSYRLATMVKYLIDSSEYISGQGVHVRVSRLVTQTLMTIPIVLQFFPVYMVCFYFFGALGVQLTELAKPDLLDIESKYSKYGQYANFQNFLRSQFFMVQLLVEGGWSSVAVEYADRYPNAYAIVLVLFSACHFALVLIISSLIKGVIWDIYEQISQEYTKKTREALTLAKQEQQLATLKSELNKIKQIAGIGQLEVDNIVAREIYEYRLDSDIYTKLEDAQKDPNSKYQINSASRREKQLPNPRRGIERVDQQQDDSFKKRVRLDQQQLQKQKEIAQKDDEEQDGADLFVVNLLKKQSQQAVLTNHMQKYDIEGEAEKIATAENKDIDVLFKRDQVFSESIAHPPEMIRYIEEKLQPIRNYKLNLQANIYVLGQSISSEKEFENLPTTHTSNDGGDEKKCKSPEDLFVYTMYEMLGIKTKASFQKAEILKIMVKDKALTEAQSSEALLKKQQDDESRELFHFSSDYILKKTFLQQASEKFAKKLQIQYFSSIYGPKFKQIDKLTMQPLVRLQSKLILSFSNMLRYENMDDKKFFHFLSEIENSISSKLLKKGSIFKFMFQIDSDEQSWFGLKIRQNGLIRLTFIKNGIWTHLDTHEPNQIYLAKDLFNCEEIEAMERNKNKWGSESVDPSAKILERRKELLRSLFSSFQTLALSLKAGISLLEESPNHQIFDFFSIYQNVKPSDRQRRRFSISRVMLAILSKQGLREQYNMQPILCPLTKIETQNEFHRSKSNNLLGALLDEQNNEEEDEDILKKMEKVQDMDDIQIQETQGLPHQFVTNLLQEISDVLALHGDTLIDMMEKLLNRQQNWKKKDDIARDALRLLITRSISLKYEEEN